MSTLFLLSVPGAGEWIFIILFVIFVITVPVVSGYYLVKAMKLRKENKVLQKRIMDLDPPTYWRRST